MPPRWPRKPDRNDPAFRKLDDRMTFATHVALFIATNSGMWFFKLLQQQDWPWTLWVTGGWAIALFAHGVFIFAIADYSDPQTSQSKSRGFG
ncbi:MAG: 2TM domain-containing protein [Leptolyngbyaceae bacterium]|nr:2TM domain-containing protein [Leptolyngbyaceae bacterium]